MQNPMRIEYSRCQAVRYARPRPSTFYEVMAVAMITVHRQVRVDGDPRRRIGEEGDVVGMCGRAFTLEREQIFAVAAHDRLRDFGPRSQGIDGDKGSGEPKPLEQLRDGDRRKADAETFLGPGVDILDLRDRVSYVYCIDHGEV